MRTTLEKPATNFFLDENKNFVWLVVVFSIKTGKLSAERERKKNHNLRPDQNNKS